MQQPFAIFDLDTSSWKTPTYSLFEGWESFSETWPRSGTMRNGRVSERVTWVPRTDAGGASSSRGWPTPTSADSGASGSADYPSTATRNAGTTLTDAVRRWPTPITSDANGSTGLGSQRGQLSEAVHPMTPQGRTGPTLYPHPAFVEWLMGFPAGWVTDLCPELSPDPTSVPTDAPPSEPLGTP